jgi:ribonuclease PH
LVSSLDLRVKKKTVKRVDGRSSEAIRPVTIECGVNPYAEGSARVNFGATSVLVTASVENEVPKWMSAGKGGWITGEYGMLPRATHTRNRREASAGKQGGRTLEIQRLIGRSLRAAIDLRLLEGITVCIDCDVLVADGGTRTAAISGGWVALKQALLWAQESGLLRAEVPVCQIAAVSVGMVEGKKLLDLCYEEDSTADFDLNLVVNERREIIEIQGTGERRGLPIAEMQELVALAEPGFSRIFEVQRLAIECAK